MKGVPRNPLWCTSPHFSRDGDDRLPRRVPFAPEGWLFILPVIILAAAAILIQWWIAAIILGALAAFMLNFFRDPSRSGSERHVDVLSPADGTVVQIRDAGESAPWPGL